MNKNILISIDKLPVILKQDYQFIDLRQPHDYAKVHLTKFINIPIDSFVNNPPSLNKNIPIILICYSGNNSSNLADKLNQQGYQAYSISGGMYSIEQTTKKEIR